jgi:8-oxo-dGTP pyrophosphatase MutT (NUDIX family)
MTRLPCSQTTLIRKIFSRLLHAGFLARRGVTLGVRAVVRSDDGKFLLVRHTYTLGWHFPGGGVEKNQTSETALIEELKQETGLTVSGQPKLHGIFFNRDVSKRDHVLVYLCETTGDLPENPPSFEIAEARYFGLADLPDDIDPGTERRLREILDTGDVSRDW